MPQVSGQLRQQFLYVGPLLVPRYKSMNGEGVAQIMQSRLTASAIDPFDIRILTQAFEFPFDERALYRCAPAQDKKGRRTTLIVASFCSPHCVSSHLLIQFGSQRHHSCLVELRVANGE